MFAVPQLVVRGKREYAWSMDSQVKKPKRIVGAAIAEIGKRKGAKRKSSRKFLFNQVRRSSLRPCLRFPSRKLLNRKRSA